MTNEEYLANKFSMSQYANMKDLLEDKVKYLEQQINWMQENLCGLLVNVEYNVCTQSIDKNGYEFTSQGSCLLEAIDNAQKEEADA